MKLINLPSRLKLTSVSPFIEKLNRNIDNPEVWINFHPLIYSFPVPMLVLGSALRNYIQRRDGLITKAFGIDNQIACHSYLKHLGFFDYINLNIGKKVGEATGNNKYLPITRIDRRSLELEVSSPYRELRHIILERSKMITNLLVDKEEEECHRMLSYCIREIIRNVFEHSKSDECYICGQKWYDKSVQIGIIDEGVGIRHTLNAYSPLENDREALEEAIRPGISCCTLPDSENYNKDNSGFGLYVLSEIGKEFGEFNLGSGKTCLIYSKNERCDSIIHNGTFVGLHIKRVPYDFGKQLDQIIYNGEFEAHISGRSVSASASSKEFY